MFGSVLRQSSENIEHILVDNGSDDGSGAMLDDYARNNPRRRISVIHQANTGVAAYEQGLEKARGEYVAFLDSDDYLADNFCEVLCHAALAENADICKGECIFQDMQGRLSPPTRDNQLIRWLNSRLGFFASFQTAIYKLQLLREHDIHFRPEANFALDIVFQNEALLACRKLVLDDNAYYYRFLRPGSESHASHGLEPHRISAVMSAYATIADNLLRHQTQVEPQGIGYVILRLIWGMFIHADEAQQPSDSQRCKALALSLLQRCTPQSRPEVLNIFRRSFPKIAAQLEAMSSSGA